MRALFLGPTNPSSTSRHRADALRRLGWQVDMQDPFAAIEHANRGAWGKLNYRTGYWFTRPAVNRWLRALLSHGPDYDLCWVDGGELLNSTAVKQLQARCPKVVLFNHDDPSGTRDTARFVTLREAIPHYDLCVVVRPGNVAEFRQLGARKVLRTWMSYDEVAHRAADPSRPVSSIYANDVVFIGRRMKNEARDLHMLALLKQGLKPAIWGDNWQSSSVWSELAPCWRGSGLAGQDYVDAIRGAKICIGMLSKGNRDQHTTRSMEIPAAGGLLCAERTPEHLQLYREGEEAVFWSTPQECAQLCKKLLNNPSLAQSIREAGQRRLLANRVGNEDLCKAVLHDVSLVA